MVAMGPGCVKTRTLFFKVEFWPRLGGRPRKKILSRSREGAFSHSLGRSRPFGDARLSAASPHSTNMTYANYPARLRPKGGVTIAVDCNTTTETLATSRLSSQSVSQFIPIRRRAHIPSAQFR
jgi:hypothetical protein